MDEPKFSPDFRRRFQHLELVGAGGTAVVYKAVQTSLDRVVAVKVLSPLAFTEEDSRRRFESERQLASQLKHANIITLLSFGEDSGRPFLVFEFVEGESLRVLIERHGRLEPARALAIAEEIAQALSAAHALGIIHRDLKPENVLIDSEGITKVFDFGLAQEARPDRVKLTSAGIVVGTPGYVAPELIQGEKATPCSDLYSLGIVLFEMLTGALPFPAQSEREMMLRYLKEDLPAVSSKGVEVPDYLDRIVAKLTRRNARGRPDDAQTVAAALERCRRKLGSAPRLARDGTLVEQRPEVDHGFDPLPTPVSRARSQTRVTAQFAKVKRGSLVALVLLVVLSAGLIRLFMSQAPQPVLVREVGPPRVIPGVTSASLQWETSGLAPTGIWLWEQDEKQALGITGKQEEPALVHQLTLTNLDREKHYDFRLQLPDNRRSTTAYRISTRGNMAGVMKAYQVRYLDLDRVEVKFNTTLALHIGIQLGETPPSWVQADTDGNVTIELKLPDREGEFEPVVVFKELQAGESDARRGANGIHCPLIPGAHAILKRFLEFTSGDAQAHIKELVRLLMSLPDAHQIDRMRPTSANMLTPQQRAAVERRGPEVVEDWFSSNAHLNFSYLLSLLPHLWRDTSLPAGTRPRLAHAVMGCTDLDAAMDILVGRRPFRLVEILEGYAPIRTGPVSYQDLGRVEFLGQLVDKRVRELLDTTALAVYTNFQFLDTSGFVDTAAQMIDYKDAAAALAIPDAQDPKHLKEVWYGIGKIPATWRCDARGVRVTATVSNMPREASLWVRLGTDRYVLLRNVSGADGMITSPYPHPARRKIRKHGTVLSAQLPSGYLPGGDLPIALHFTGFERVSNVAGLATHFCFVAELSAVSQ